MLHEVIEWARREDLVIPPGFKVKAVKWALVFDLDGDFRQVRELGDPSAKRNRGQHLPCPNLELGEMKRGGTGTRHFLVDNAGVVTLLGAEEDDEKLRAKHEYFVGLLEDASEVTPELGPVAEALADPALLERIRGELEEEGASPTENITFEVIGAEPELVVEGHSWREWYQAFRAGLQKEKSPLKMRCLVTGELTTPVATHSKIKGLTDVGALSMGAVLPAFKQESFRSYGLEQAANAPMSEESASGYVAALNRLIRKQGRKLAGNKIVYWYQQSPAEEDDPMGWLEQPLETEEAGALGRARKLLSALREGERPDLAGNRYYVLILSANSSRVVLRDWFQGPFEELVANVEAWFEDLRLVTRDGRGLTSPPKLWAVLGSMARELDELPDPLIARMWRVAVRNEPIPQQAAARALQRFRIAVTTDDTPRTAGVGLLKAYLRRLPDHDTRYGERDDMSPGLNESHTSDAYHCGRLLALLDYLQYRALGDVGAGVIQRYYGAASATPGLVLGRLLRMAQFHLNKLEPGERIGHEKRIAKVMDHFEDRFPSTLDLEQQSLFALGYYHQKAHRSPKAGESGEEETTEVISDETAQTAEETP